MRAQTMYWLIPAILAGLIILTVILNNPIAMKELKPILSMNITENQTNNTINLAYTTTNRPGVIYSLENINLGASSEFYYAKNLNPIKNDTIIFGYVELEYIFPNIFERVKSVQFLVLDNCEKVVLYISNFKSNCPVTVELNRRGFTLSEETNNIAKDVTSFIVKGTNSLTFSIKSAIPVCSASMDYRLVCLNRSRIKISLPKDNYRKEIQIVGEGDCTIYIDSYKYEGTCNIIKDVTNNKEISLTPNYNLRNLTIKLVIYYPKKISDIFYANATERYLLIYEASAPIRVCINSYCIMAKKYNNILPEGVIRDGPNLITVETHYTSYLDRLIIEHVR